MRPPLQGVHSDVAYIKTYKNNQCARHCDALGSQIGPPNSITNTASGLVDEEQRNCARTAASPTQSASKTRMARRINGRTRWRVVRCDDRSRRGLWWRIGCSLLGRIEIWRHRYAPAAYRNHASIGSTRITATRARRGAVAQGGRTSEVRTRRRV